ncbi:Acid-sensing ion channel 1C [Collichthys lucidus]|uniref:Acid-sensing ion channel 1C n=1 Tax=Collichthys lucidus TaxID=240159 RepID=A0A4U5UWQ9_COLLU|nr:Acid-sensing ion channel 1C [Collichthys lucidus]
MKGSSEESIESIRPSNLQAFANISTLHGMSHIFAYGHMTFRRFLWTLSFLGSLGLLMLVCMDRVSYYLEYPHVTKLDEVAATNLTFPAVTFCNLNEFRFSRITRNDLYHVGELLALLNNNYQIANPHLAEPEVLAALKDKANFQNFKPKLFNMTDFYNRTGHDINDMLLQCTFRGEDCYPVNFTTTGFSRLHSSQGVSDESNLCLRLPYVATQHLTSADNSVSYYSRLLLQSNHRSAVISLKDSHRDRVW